MLSALYTILLLVFFSLISCDSTRTKSKNPINTDDDNDIPKPSLTGNPNNKDLTFNKLKSMYGNIKTIAGTGKYREKAYNGWRAKFEGASAVNVELSRPHNALADSEDNIYIADKDAHAIRKITPNGKIYTVAGTSKAGDDGDDPGPGNKRRLKFPNGIWVKADGTVFILDLGNSKIRKLDPSGTMTTLFKDKDSILFGRGLWVSENEELVYYSSGTKLKKWTESNGVETLASGFAGLANLAVDEDGSILLTDRVGNRVYRITPDGQKTVVAGTGGTKGGGDGQPATKTAIYEVRGVWIHPEGGYFLATHAGSQVWYVDPDGYIHLFLNGAKTHVHSGDGKPYNSPGFKISEPRSISMDFEGNIILAENDYGYIRVIEKL